MQNSPCPRPQALQSCPKAQITEVRRSSRALLLARIGRNRGRLRPIGLDGVPEGVQNSSERRLLQDDVPLPGYPCLRGSNDHRTACMAVVVFVGQDPAIDETRQTGPRVEPIDRAAPVP